MNLKWLLLLAITAGALLAGPCTLPEPGEGYTSTNCGTFGDIPVLGQWVMDLGDPLFVDGVCIFNSDYYVNGVEEYQVYDGAPRGDCGTAPPPPPIFPPPEPPGPPIVPPPPPTPVPEPGNAGLVLLGMIAVVVGLVMARKKL